MKRRTFTFLFGLLFSVVPATAQTLDPEFQPPLPIRAARIECMKVQADGKILIGGEISFFGAKKVNNLIRLNPDGSLDDTFTFAQDTSYLITDIEIQSSGNIVVLGLIYFPDTGAFGEADKIIRLSPSGSLVNVIHTLKLANAIAVQNDDKIVVGGYSFPGGYLHRYNADFSPDAAFNNAVSLDGQVNDIVVDGDKLFVTGSFSTVNASEKKDIVKLNSDGTIDSEFDTGSGTTDYVGSLTVQPDGKILVSKTYIGSYDGTPTYGMIRLNSDGSLDTEFTSPSISGGVSEILVLDDRIYVSSYFYEAGVNLIRLTMDGTQDFAFNPIRRSFGSVADMNFVFAGEKLLVDNTAVDKNPYGLSAYTMFGIQDSTFLPKIGRYGTITTGFFADGKLVVGGDFVKIDDVDSYGIAKINTDGSVDESFVMPENKGAVRQMEILRDGNILVTTGEEFFKLSSTGELLPGFDYEDFKTLYYVSKFSVQENDKIIAGSQNNVYRLNSDGSEDTSFDIGTGICCTIASAFDFDTQPDGKVIFGSVFNEFNGTPVPRLVRLNANGTVDQTFQAGDGPDGTVFLIKVLDTREILIGGDFSSFNGVAVPYGLVKLSENGKLDSVFNENQKLTDGPGRWAFLEATVVQLGARIFIRGLDLFQVLTIDGKEDKKFIFPGAASGIITDIVAADSTGLYVLGIFHKGLSTGRKSEHESNPSFMVKLNIEYVPVSVQSNITTGIEWVRNSEEMVDVYPNPVTESLQIDFKEEGSFSVVLYDVAGKAVHQSNFLKNSKNGAMGIDFRDYHSGFYFLKVISDAGKTSFIKVSKPTN